MWVAFKRLALQERSFENPSFLAMRATVLSPTHPNASDQSIQNSMQKFQNQKQKTQVSIENKLKIGM
jgi:hypothetical protein